MREAQLYDTFFSVRSKWQVVRSHLCLDCCSKWSAFAYIHHELFLSGLLYLPALLGIVPRTLKNVAGIQHYVADVLSVLLVVHVILAMRP